MNPALRDLFLGGEDEEEQDLDPSPAATVALPPTDLHQPGADHAYLNVDVRTNPDGSATVWYHTNDRDSDGVPDRNRSSWNELLVSWDEHHASVEQAKRQVGSSRVEPSGRVLTVYHDGTRQD